LAEIVLDAFDQYRADFDRITARAGQRFSERDWHGMRADAAERLDLYAEAVASTAVGLDRDSSAWTRAKTAFQDLIEGHPDEELGQTFFNSVSRRVLGTVGVDAETTFVDPIEPNPPLDFPVYRGSPVEVLTAILETSHLLTPDQVRRGAEVAAARLAAQVGSAGFEAVEAIPTPFYRGTGAYLVGRVLTDAESFPLCLALVNPESGARLDAVLLEEDAASILFSFTRAYFHVQTEQPAQLVAFLHRLLPKKRISELYRSIGFDRHGKSCLHRELRTHLDESAQRFEEAPGTPGLVMVVFALPDLDLVFKVIRDGFPPSKHVTPQEVRTKYKLVFRADRVGRLIDAHEFEGLVLARHRFEPRLLQLLAAECSRSVTIEGESVLIHHAYLERRVTPLDLHLRQVGAEAAEESILDYGAAVKDLAAADIFPGDMLLKNFGVTRHGRVVFYDYDELTRVTACVFRDLPAAANEEDELSADPWFGVGNHDIFPAELVNYLGVQGPLRASFLSKHGDLYHSPFWQGIQTRLRAGELIDIFPYQARHRVP